jgi:hypothetical protein
LNLRHSNVSGFENYAKADPKVASALVAASSELRWFDIKPWLYASLAHTNEGQQRMDIHGNHDPLAGREGKSKSGRYQLGRRVLEGV